MEGVKTLTNDTIRSTHLQLQRVSVMTRVAIFREKSIPRNTEQMEILIRSVGIPSVRGTENARNSVPLHSMEDKKAQNSVPTIS